jgi:hypothetical protein
MSTKNVDRKKDDQKKSQPNRSQPKREIDQIQMSTKKKVDKRKSTKVDQNKKADKTQIDPRNDRFLRFCWLISWQPGGAGMALGRIPSDFRAHSPFG